MTAPARGAIGPVALLRSSLLRGVVTVADVLPGGAAPALTAPTNLVPPSLSGTPTQGQTLTLTPGSWSGNPVPSVTRDWQRDGLSTGQTGLTYNLTAGDIGGTITVVETATNSQGSATSTSNGIGPVVAAGALSAPRLDYPAPLMTNPTSIGVHFDQADWQTGDTLKLQYASDAAFTTPTTLTHVLTDADTAPGATITMGIPTLAGVTYFRAWGSHSGVDSANKSNIVAWGDNTAPTITTAATFSIQETVPLAIALTANEGVTWAIVGGADRLQFQVSGSTLEWYGNGVQSYSSPKDVGADNVYNVTVQATDYAGNSSTLAITVTVTQIDSTPDAFPFTPVTNATLSTQYTSNTVTFTGLEVGFNIPASVSAGEYQKNGGAWTPAGSFTVQNGDTLAVRQTSSSSDSTETDVNVTVGTLTETFSVTTAGYAQLVTTTGPNKSRNVTVSDGSAATYPAISVTSKKWATTLNDGNLDAVKAGQGPANTKWHAEFRIEAFSGLSSPKFWCGIADASLDLDNTTGHLVAGQEPGRTAGQLGLSVTVGGPTATGITVYANGGQTNVNIPGLVNPEVGQDAIILEGDLSTHTISVYYHDASAGTNTLMTTKTLTTPPSSPRAYGGGYKTGDSGVFIPVSYLMPYSTGYSNY